MKKSVIAFIGMVLFSLSCGKTVDSGCTPATVASEKTAMIAYCTANSINYTEHPSGILYEIVSPGTGTAPSLASNVSCLYTGKLMNGTTFDAATSNPATFPLANVIEGWKIGIPLIKAGGRIKLVIPSALAYSCVGSGSIAPNSPLFFDVTLVQVR
ncbi:MAG: FKBP-type peptidyl-prolyl cis-trans isomerase [Sphingobacteriia bacterium]|jgi:FKBP-type peptidyl-prolyl cis-trans isomerase